MKPCIINAYSETRADERYFASRTPFADSFTEMKIIFPTYPGNLARFMHIPDILKDDGWYIFTDTSDVVMQGAVPSLDAVSEGVIVADESETHENSYWKPYCVGEFKYLLHKPIYNGGLFAMKGFYLSGFIETLKKYEDKNKHGNVDQLVLNMFCQKTLGNKVYHHKTLFTTLYANVIKGNIEKKGKHWFTKSGELITFVHGNGSTKENL